MSTRTHWSPAARQGQLRLRRLVVWAALALAAGCADGSALGTAPSTTGAGEGESCGPAQACAGVLLCVDGVCRERTWPRPTHLAADAARLDLPWPPPDVARPGEVGPTDVAASLDAVDADADADAASGGDAPDAGLAEGLVDGSEDAAIASDAGSPLSDLPVDAGLDAGIAADLLPDPGTLVDTPPPLDLGPPDPGPEASGGADAGPLDTGGPPVTYILLLSDDKAETSPANTSAVLEQGQAWVTELDVPLPGRLLALQVVARDSFSVESCAFFRPALWLPDDAGAYGYDADWWAPSTKPVQGLDAPQLVWVDVPPDVPAGRVRVGLELDGACLGEPPAPVLVSDDSGHDEDSWVWAPQPSTSPWVPAGFVGIQGRWGLRMLLEVTVP